VAVSGWTGFGPDEAVRVAVSDDVQVDVVGDAAAGQHGVQLLPGLLGSSQAMHGVGCDPLRDVHGGGVAPFGPLFCATSRDTVDTDRPSSPAIAVSVFFCARPREIVSRSSIDNRNGGRGRPTRGRTPPDWVNQ
jgi:hypothetical protein